MTYIKQNIANNEQKEFSLAVVQLSNLDKKKK